jgi:hypothetical protein
VICPAKDVGLLFFDHRFGGAQFAISTSRTVRFEPSWRMISALAVIRDDGIKNCHLVEIKSDIAGPGP